MNHIEEKIIQTIDEHRDEIIAFAKDIQSHPEPGFYEERTAAHVAAFFAWPGTSCAWRTCTHRGSR